MTTPQGDAIEHPILFFDGVCGLCNRFVDRVLRADRDSVLRFAPLQGETAKRLLASQPQDPAAWSVVYLDEHGVHCRSEATLRVYSRLGGFYRAVGWLRIVPRCVRDSVYRLIARNRYRWFGRRDACRVPSAEERDRFLP